MTPTPNVLGRLLKLLNKLFQRCFVVNAGDIPECIYDKTGEKFSLDKGKCQGSQQEVPELPP